MSHALPPLLVESLEQWTRLRGQSPGPLFCPIDRRGNLRLGHTLTGEGIRQSVRRLALLNANRPSLPERGSVELLNPGPVPGVIGS